MARPLRRILSFKFPGFTAPLALLAVCLISYSLLISHLGFYWDDWPINWIAQRLGADGLTRYFATNRPVWGMLYKLTTPLLGPEPWHWHIFAVFWRWLSAVALWWLLRIIWPRHQEPALWASLLLAVYPGSTEQFIALVYSHFFIVLAAFFASLACSIQAIRKPRFFWHLTIAGLLLSLLNLASMEYFFLLEMLRPVLIWVTLRETKPQWHARLKRTITRWLPYLFTFLAVGIWRTFFFNFQTTNYRPTFLDNLGTQPIESLLALLGTALNDIWVTTFVAWGQVFIPPNPAELGRITTLIYAVVVLSTAIALVFYLLKLKNAGLKDKRRTQTWALPAMVIGLLGLLLGGIPFWMIELPVNLGFPSSRLTIAFMPGVSIFRLAFWASSRFQSGQNL